MRKSQEIAQMIKKLEEKNTEAKKILNTIISPELMKSYNLSYPNEITVKAFLMSFLIDNGFLNHKDSFFYAIKFIMKFIVNSKEVFREELD